MRAKFGRGPTAVSKKVAFKFISRLFIICFHSQEVHVGNNCIMGLTREHLEGMCNVIMLDLRDNKISHIPDDITLLQSLERIDLTNNNLTTYVTRSIW